MILLISELNDQRYLALASKVSPDHIENDWVTCFETIQHALEIRERSYRRAIDFMDHVAFVHGRSTPRGNAQFRDESVWIDLFNVKPLHAGQVTIGEQLRSQFCERDAESQCVATWIGIFRSGFNRWHKLSSG